MKYFGRHLKTRNESSHLFHLPPCQPLLKLHGNRNLIGKIWGRVDQKIMLYESPQQHGKVEDYSLEWVNEIFPTDIANHLDARDVECDYDNDFVDECDEDGFD